MEKNSFTLFETLFSIFILSIIIVGFAKSSNYDSFDEEFMLLNDIENSFNTDIYNSNFSSSQKTIEITKNETSKESIVVKQITYKDKSIKLIKYKLN